MSYDSYDTFNEVTTVISSIPLAQLNDASEGSKYPHLFPNVRGNFQVQEYTGEYAWDSH